jgi:hypothetical protein
MSTTGGMRCKDAEIYLCVCIPAVCIARLLALQSRGVLTVYGARGASLTLLKHV